MDQLGRDRGVDLCSRRSLMRLRIGKGGRRVPSKGLIDGCTHRRYLVKQVDEILSRKQSIQKLIETRLKQRGKTQALALP